jgi:hypothetical protein
MNSNTKFVTRNGRLVACPVNEIVLATVSLAGTRFELAEATPRPVTYGEYYVAIRADGSNDGVVRQWANYYDRSGDVVWIVREKVLVPRAKPTAGVLLVPSHKCVDAGYTGPLKITDFRQPVVGEAYVSRRYKAGAEVAKVFLIETERESADKANGRWIVKQVGPSLRSTPPRPAAPPAPQATCNCSTCRAARARTGQSVTLTAAQIAALRAALDRGADGVADANDILNG